MSLGQNDRSRGRQTNRGREPNPLTRSYDSHGPDVRIRGSALHVAERYLQLARDAHTGSNPIAAENYLQHAEHYFRLIAAAQAAQLQAQMGDVRATGESGPEDLDDDGRSRWSARSLRLSGAARAASLHQPKQCRCAGCYATVRATTALGSA